MDRFDGRNFTKICDRLSRVIAMRFKELDTVVLERDVPEHGLRRGDLGAVVQVYDPD